MMIRFIVFFVLSTLLHYLVVSGVVSFLGWDFELLDMSTISNGQRFVYMFTYFAWQSISTLLYLDSDFRAMTFIKSNDEQEPATTRYYASGTDLVEYDD